MCTTHTFLISVQASAHTHTHTHTHTYTNSLHEPQMRRLASAICEVETMCFHNLSETSGCAQDTGIYFLPPICTWPSSKKSMQIHRSLNPFPVVHSEICNGYIDSGRQTTSGMSAELKAAGGQKEKKKKKKLPHILPADKLCNRQTMVSRPEESNLKGISGRMSAEQVDHDVT